MIKQAILTFWPACVIITLIGVLSGGLVSWWSASFAPLISALTVSLVAASTLPHSFLNKVRSLITIPAGRQNPLEVLQEERKNWQEEQIRLQNAKKNIMCDMEKFQNYVAGRSATLLELFSEMTEQHEVEMEYMGEALSQVSDLNKSIHKIAANTEQATQEAYQTKKDTDRAVNTILNTVSGMQEVLKMVNEAADSIEKLREASERVSDILENIDQIASQTNLLAINASIESAHAGQQGKGFGIIASEVDQLASKTTGATDDIKEVLEKIKETTEASTKGIHRGLQRITEEVDSVTDTGERLAEMMNQMDKVVKAMESISNATEIQSERATTIENYTKKLSKSSRSAAIQVEKASQFADEFIGSIKTGELQCEDEETEKENKV